MTKGYKIFQYYILAYTAKTVKEKNLSMKDPDPDPTTPLHAQHQHQDQIFRLNETKAIEVGRYKSPNGNMFSKTFL